METPRSGIITRRAFLAGTGLAAARILAQDSPAAKAATAVPPVCVFSKHLQFLDYAALGKAARELGLDGVDLTVRDGGHVLPARVAEDLPRAVEAVRAEGLDVYMITTSFQDGRDPLARKALETASKLGIRYFRISGHKYAKDTPPEKTLDKVTGDLRGLAELAEEFNMIAGYHNHSGFNNVGAPVWDLKLVYDRVASPNLGANLDLGHVTVEGTYGDWEITTRMIARQVNMIAVKDFQWKGDRPEWVPLGEGIVRITEMLGILRQAGFAGPVSMHFEYDVEDNEELLAHIRAAGAHVRECLRGAGYAA